MKSHRHSVSAAFAGIACVLAACGGGGSAGTPTAVTVTAQTTAPSAPPPAQTVAPPPARSHGSTIALLPSAVRSAARSWRPAATVGGRPVAWSAHVSTGGASVTLVRFDQSLTELALHAGAVDPGGTGWRHGSVVGPAERRRLVAAFNGGFRFSADAGGFKLGGRTAKTLQYGLASIVTYSDGFTDIGAWRQGVPAPGRTVASVRQDVHLLIDGGRPAATIDCGHSCWGFTLHGVPDPARSALGITRSGQLVWAGGEHLTASGLADAMVGAGVRRAAELDINPDWVGGYLYTRDGQRSLPLVDGERPPPERFLAGDARDFFTVVAR